jgi:hypothetical protein
MSDGGTMHSRVEGDVQPNSPTDVCVQIRYPRPVCVSFVPYVPFRLLPDSFQIS